MIIVGLVLLAAAVAAAVILIVQNRDIMVDVHALGNTWSSHLYWVLVAGLIIALAGVLGLAMMRGGATRARRQRRERARLIVENERLSERVRNPDDSSFFSGDAAASGDSATTNSAAPGAVPTEKTHFFRRGHHAS